MSPLTARLALRSPPSVISQAALTLDFYRAIPLSIEVAVFDAAGIASLTGVTSLTLMVKATREGTDAAALMSKTVSSFTSCTAPQWVAGTNEHAVFEFTAAECNLDLSGGAKASFWLVFKGLLSTGDEVILGTGRATCYEANATAAGDPPENPNPSISIADADARYLRLEAQTLETAQKLQALTNLGLAWAAGSTLSADRLTLSNGKFIWLQAAP